MKHKNTLKNTGKIVMPVFIVAMITLFAALIGSFVLDLDKTNPKVEITENTDENKITIKVTKKQNANSIWITTSNIPNSKITGSLNSNQDTTTKKYHLLNKDGDSTTISIDTEELTTQSEIKIISKSNNESTVLRTYKPK